jgi:hypothetical protein
MGALSHPRIEVLTGIVEVVELQRHPWLSLPLLFDGGPYITQPPNCSNSKHTPRRGHVQQRKHEQGVFCRTLSLSRSPQPRNPNPDRRQIPRWFTAEEVTGKIFSSAAASATTEISPSYAMEGTAITIPILLFYLYTVVDKSHTIIYIIIQSLSLNICYSLFFYMYL